MNSEGRPSDYQELSEEFWRLHLWGNMCNQLRDTQLNICLDPAVRTLQFTGTSRNLYEIRAMIRNDLQSVFAAKKLQHVTVHRETGAMIWYDLMGRYSKVTNDEKFDALMGAMASILAPPFGAHAEKKEGAKHSGQEYPDNAMVSAGFFFNNLCLQIWS